MKISRPVLVNASLAVVIVGAIAASLILTLPQQASTAEATQLTTTVQQGAVSSTITASGSIAANREVAADFSVSGTVKKIYIALGDTVKQGDKIGTLETDEFEDALADATDTLADAYGAVVDATSAISDANSDIIDANDAIADAEDDEDSSDQATASSASQALDSAEQQLDSANSQKDSALDQLDTANDQVDDALDAVDAAQDDLDATTLYAPNSGLITALSATVGGTSGSSSGSSSSSSSGSSDAAAGSTTTSTSSSGFATISMVNRMTMTAAIAEADIADVEVGQTADVTFPALTDVTTTATVTAISPTATASNSVVTYSTTITLDEIPDGLRLGQTAEVAITTVSSADDALYVPTAAITTATDGTSTVDVVGDDDETTTTTVELGVVGDEGTEITSGLEEGQTVVLGTVTPTDDTATTTETGTGGFGGGAGGGGTGGFGGGTAPTGGFPGGN